MRLQSFRTVVLPSSFYRRANEPSRSLDKEALYGLAPDQDVNVLQRTHTIFCLVLTLMPWAVEYLEQLLVFHPELKNRLAKACEERSFQKINQRLYVRGKEGIVLFESLLKEQTDMPHEEQGGLVKEIFDETTSEKSTGLLSQAWSLLPKPPPNLFSQSQSNQSYSSTQRREVKQQAAKIDDAEFLSQLEDTVLKFPVLTDAASEIVKQAQDYLKEILEKQVDHVVSRTEHAQLEEFKRQLKAHVETDRKRQEDDSRREFLEEVQDAYRSSDRTRG